MRWRRGRRPHGRSQAPARALARCELERARDTQLNRSGAPDFYCIQEVAVAAAPREEPAPSGAAKWIVNEVKPWDTTIAMQSTWEDRAIDIACHEYWVAATFAAKGTERYVTVASVHMPTSRISDETWMQALRDLDSRLTKWKRRGITQTILVAGDFNLSCPRTRWPRLRAAREAALAEFVSRWGLRDTPGSRGPTQVEAPCHRGRARPPP